MPRWPNREVTGSRRSARTKRRPKSSPRWPAAIEPGADGTRPGGQPRSRVPAGVRAGPGKQPAGAVAALENTRARLLTSKLARAAYRASPAVGPARPETSDSVLRQLEQFELIRDSGQSSTPEKSDTPAGPVGDAPAHSRRRPPGVWIRVFRAAAVPGQRPRAARQDRHRLSVLDKHGGYALIHLARRCHPGTGAVARRNRQRVQDAAVFARR